MSLTDRISGDLKAMAAGTRRAQQDIGAVDHAVEQIGARASAAGFTGVAVGLIQVRGVLGRVRAQLTTIGGVLDEAARSVAVVPQQPSLQEVIAALTPVMVALTVGESGIAASAAQIEEAQRLAVVALRGGQPGQTLAGLHHLQQILSTVRSRGGAARQVVGAALAQARQVGALGASTTGCGGVDASQSVPSPSGHRPGPPRAQESPPGGGQPPAQAVTFPEPVDPCWSRADHDMLPDTVRAAVSTLTPRPAGSTRPTQGFFNGMPITSGGGDRSLAADLDHDPLRGPPVTFYDHAESKAAAHLRRDGSGEADLAIDNTVCGTNDRDQAYPWTCDKILPAILPAGSRLRVWVTRDGGTTWWHRIYTGTGERISR
ncbi:DUF6244 family protein [Micromonospora rubida]|uniref:DUF6244 family protein n=1 Tax=Micromonospora rubida TaxID=2697657 RepID=A0ABW7STK0_9ACTN